MYNLHIRRTDMKEIMKSVHRPAKYVFMIGWIIIAAVVAASTVLYIGAGEAFDYYSAVALSEKLLASARPVSVVVFAASTGIEYCSKKKNSSTS